MKASGGNTGLTSIREQVAAANQRAGLDLQASNLAEHEITKLVSWVPAMADDMEVAIAADDPRRRDRGGIAPGTVQEQMRGAAAVTGR